MSVIVLVSPLAKRIPIIEDAVYAGIDAGALRCMEQGIPMVFALGDFDTAKDGSLPEIETQTECLKLPSHKDETDMESAFLEARRRGYDKIILYGVLQGRFDHTMANLYLLLYRDPSIVLMDECNRVQVLGEGTYLIEKRYTYLSFLALEDCCISEKGVAYPVDHKMITTSDILTVSNEIVNRKAVITIHKGKVLMIESEDPR